MKSIFLKGDLKSVRRDDEGGWAVEQESRETIAPRTFPPPRPLYSNEPLACV